MLYCGIYYSIIYSTINKYVYCVYIQYINCIIYTIYILNVYTIHIFTHKLRFGYMPYVIVILININNWIYNRANSNDFGLLIYAWIMCRIIFNFILEEQKFRCLGKWTSTLNLTANFKFNRNTINPNSNRHPFSSKWKCKHLILSYWK